jgi:hypothetical protein
MLGAESGEEPGVHLGRGFQAAMEDVQLLSAGSKFLLQALYNFLLLLSLKDEQSRRTLSWVVVREEI